MAGLELVYRGVAVLLNPCNPSFVLFHQLLVPFLVLGFHGLPSFKVVGVRCFDGVPNCLLVFLCPSGLELPQCRHLFFVGHFLPLHFFFQSADLSLQVLPLLAVRCSFVGVDQSNPVVLHLSCMCFFIYIFIFRSAWDCSKSLGCGQQLQAVLRGVQVRPTAEHSAEHVGFGIAAQSIFEDVGESAVAEGHRLLILLQLTNVLSQAGQGLVGSFFFFY
mmetsp:Transcript_47285/g.93030  ORF Transcript_47285/g.93030 Transcript_47285/m.93030 type:complete len:218 (-) Transcript_47285:892-1545(-)